MLILTRRIGESIKIGDDIDVTIFAIKGRQIRLGIKAPDDIIIHREEIYNKIQKATKSNAHEEINKDEE